MTGAADRHGPGRGGGRDLRRFTTTGGLSMHVSQLEWIITLGVTIAVLLFDVIVIGRRPHEPSKRELVTALSIYIGLAVAFGLWVWFFHGSQFGLEFFAGWLTEYSLSVDNLFIFLIIMASFNVPKKYPAAGAAGRHHPGADLPRHLHRAGRGGDQPVLVGLLRLRRVPGLHRVQPGPRHRPRRRRRELRGPLRATALEASPTSGTASSSGSRKTASG